MDSGEHHRVAPLPDLNLGRLEACEQCGAQIEWVGERYDCAKCRKYGIGEGSAAPSPRQLAIAVEVFIVRFETERRQRYPATKEGLRRVQRGT